MKKKTTNS